SEIDRRTLRPTARGKQSFFRLEVTTMSRHWPGTNNYLNASWNNLAFRLTVGQTITKQLVCEIVLIEFHASSFRKQTRPCRLSHLWRSCTAHHARSCACG